MTTVAAIDIGGVLAGDPGAMGAAPRTAGDACATSGCFIVLGHGVPSDRVNGVMDTARSMIEDDQDS